MYVKVYELDEYRVFTSFHSNARVAMIFTKLNIHLQIVSLFFSFCFFFSAFQFNGRAKSIASVDYLQMRNMLSNPDRESESSIDFMFWRVLWLNDSKWSKDTDKSSFFLRFTSWSHWIHFFSTKMEALDLGAPRTRRWN